MKIGIGLLLCLLTVPVFAKPKGYLPASPLWKKLNSIVIEHIEFEDSDTQTVFKLLQVRSKDLDPEGKGINFVCKGLKDHKTLVTLKLDNLPLAEVIKYVCLAGDLIYKVDDYAVVVMPKPPAEKQKEK